MLRSTRRFCNANPCYLSMCDACCLQPLLLTGGLSCTEIMKIRKIQTDLDLDLIEDEEMMTKLRGGKVRFS